ncbi:dihydrofolate reductase family protein [Agromyces aerolatus]|uniref:dihydrofolate reductase family protein n=1 Tax=Agromyces sp. LY-1074 TaxID=3074080 RepID=UPI00285E0722|nr:MULTISPECIES: dihydrofolate reductase family protein [unclassified Agromyces]MDR5699201.1 dihydrofolate reductase family protein [Agromyces sp. LY-1074]MDR5705497.1 dihydrofolate reductase family protein [Agromyces sp. LY-1358]
MRRLRYTINVMLDGCVDHRASTGNEAVHRHATATLARADALILGRVTYRMMEEAWRPPVSEAMPDWTRPFASTIDGAKKYVVSSTLEQVDWNAELISGDLGEAVRRLKELPGDELYVGGVALPTALAELGLIDEYEFVVHPRVAGRGPYLLEGLTTPLDLEPAGRDDLGDGIVAMRYVPRAALPIE